MQQLITESQARKITGGRKPLVPLEYERACKDLAACQTIDEAKYFADKSDALAAWAKIYKDDKAGLEARKLKLYAYRRMGLLAGELRPNRRMGGRASCVPGPSSLLQEKGLSKSTATIVRRISRLPEDDFNKQVNALRPLAPATLANKLSNPRASDAFKTLCDGTDSFIKAAAWMKRHDARTLARGLFADETVRMRSAILGMNDWLDEFEHHLPRVVERK